MKRSVTTVAGHAALINRDDIDTDALFPAPYLRLTQRSGMGRYLFADWRADARPEVAFMQAAEPPRFLVGAVNFGCGSSREQAVWALADYGVQAVLAMSFGDIFRNNCVKNDVVAATLSPDDHATLVKALAANPGAELRLDIASRTLQLPGDLDLPVVLAEGHAEQLLSAEDHIARTLHYTDALQAYEDRVKSEQPWLARID
ncbi:3-isopropylmalate dehydratase small subunit [Xylophilus sp. GOD-11R]|uniref:3-isopropylmalate dehydratase small subunit n=1 Tax=Xylophilus sp. GOD-11R TaxID=3089814 RepID=UPI00298CF700|nr:3-isopropylmalate dehydratase small subunit [Xylophilus sp. GOD-11R]WPB55433.1 3-isopropylmalate dehydratase small subunit [Xylophilus sp. GOD-11R]